MAAGALGEVASGHAEVSAAAADVLREGGNAFDAALAAGFAACVAEPMFTSLGGGGFLLARTAAGDARLFDFFVDAPGRGLPPSALTPHFEPMTVHFPASDQSFNIGRGSVAVPGTLRGFLHLHARLGSLPLRRLVEPAGVLARQGVVLNEHQAYVQELLTPIVTLTAPGRAIYARAGRAPRAGDRVLNPELAAFLETLPADGDRDFYEGALACAMAREMRTGGGLLSEADLAAYRVVERAPLAGAYRGRGVLTNPAPAPGGALIARALALVEANSPVPAAWGEPQERLALAAAMQEVERTRLPPASGGTTHVSVADARGNVASLSLSNGEGSGYLAPGTGIMLNNMLGEDDLHPEGFHAMPPGERIGSMMSPTLVLEEGRVRLALGSGGSKRIRSAIVQVVSAVLDGGLTLEAAVEAPRLHWDGEQLQLEPGLPAATRRALAERWPVNAWQARNLYFGGVHAVEPGKAAAGDPRRLGCGLRVGG